MQDENGAPLEIHAVEREEHEAALALAIDESIRAFAEILELGRRLVDDLTPRLAPVVRGDTKAEGEEPGTNRSRGVVLVKRAVDGKKNLVREILDVSLGDPEAAERAPDVRELELEQRPEIDGRSASRGNVALAIRTSH